jgi:hypothetical protein
MAEMGVEAKERLRQDVHVLVVDHPEAPSLRYVILVLDVNSLQTVTSLRSSQELWS